MRRPIKYLLNCLIVLYLGVIYFTGMPDSNSLGIKIKSKAMDVAFLLGIWPSWSMFAPDPMRVDSKTYVQISYKSGETLDYDVEKELQGPLAIFRKARWMKYAQDNLRDPGQRALLRPAINYFKKKYDSKDNPIVLIMVKRKWWQFPPFSEQRLSSIYETPREEKLEVLLSERIRK